MNDIIHTVRVAGGHELAFDDTGHAVEVRS